jgi:DNA-binding NarL/FixJ family response regulator
MKGEPWILIVEDDHDDLALIDRARGRVAPHVGVKAAGSIREALQSLHRARPALIVLDIHLSGDHGLDLLEMIRSHPTASTTPVLCMSGRDDDGTVAAAYAAGANGFMVKYADYDSCFDGVCQTLRYWLAANRVPQDGVLRDCGEIRVYI